MEYGVGAGWRGMEYCRGTWEPERDARAKWVRNYSPLIPPASTVNKLESGQDSQTERPRCKERDLVTVYRVTTESIYSVHPNVTVGVRNKKSRNSRGRGPE